MIKQCPNAFSLIELVIAMLVMAVVALVTVDYLVNAGRVYTRLLAQRQVDGDAMDVVNRMRREARVCQANIATSSVAWAFSTPAGAKSFEWSAAGRTVLMNSNVMAKNVQKFHFDYYDATNGNPTDSDLIRRVALELRVTNNQAASELKVNFFLRKGFLK